MRITIQGFCATAIVFLLAAACTLRQDGGHSEPAMFKLLPPKSTGITFANELEEAEDFNIIEYLYYYNGAGVAAGDINNDGLADLYFTSNQGENKLYLNKGNFTFEDITAKAGVAGKGAWKTGVTMADVNGDGFLDIYVSQVGQYKNIQGRNQLFINNGNLTFSEQAAQWGLDFVGFSTQAAFFDFDRDGDLDVYILRHSVHSSDVYGPSTLRKRIDNLAGDKLMRNDGTRFVDISEQAGIYQSKIAYGLGIAISDIDNNGWPDIYVSNDFHENDYLYYNNGNGTFSEGISHSTGHTSTFSMGCDIADFNNDQLPDILTLDMRPEDEVVLKSSVGADPYNIYKFKLDYGYHYQFPRNMLHLNRGKTAPDQDAGVHFSEIGQLAGVDATDWSWSALFCDVDNDGWKDIFITNGIWRRPNDLDYLKFTSSQEIQEQASNLQLAEQMPLGKVSNYIFKNNKNLTFQPMSAQWGFDAPGCSNGAAYADLDNDGDQDLIVNNLNAPAGIYQNQAREVNKHHYLRLHLRQNDANPFAIGAKIMAWTSSGVQTCELFTTRGFQSAVEPVVHLGIGQDAFVDSLWVRWPDGQWQYFPQTNADQVITIQKNASSAKAYSDGAVPPYGKMAVASSVGIDFTHTENKYDDFDFEKLLPHQLSKNGPCMAVGDVNADGYEDVYMGGAAGQAGALYIQSPNGRFSPIKQPSFVIDSLHEDADANFFDVDGDHDADLIVASGGGQANGPAGFYQHRLYINNGKGLFSKAAGTLPQSNAACVVTADFDNDGDQDIFIGSRSIPGNYSASPASWVLINKGDGQFTDQTQVLAPFLQHAGMLTDAVWLPEEHTLAIVGEWMPLTLINTQSAPWKKKEIQDTEGWWLSIAAADIDGDKDQDLIIGNMGLNSNLRATVKEPVELFAGDFDHNQSTDPLLSYYRQGKSYSYYSKDEIFTQVNIIKKRFTDYTSFAEAPFTHLFPKAEIKAAVHKKAVLFASCIAVNQSNGNFDIKPLPLEAQIAPVWAIAAFDLNGDHVKDLLLAGNWYDVQPVFGRYDASFGTALINEGKGSFTALTPQQSGWAINGQVRSLGILNEKTLLIGRNNQEALIWNKNRR